MTTKLKIDFHAELLESTLIEAFAVMIAKHNQGKVTLDLNILEGYFKARCAQYGTNGQSFLDGNTLSLSIRGKAFVTVYEMEMIGEITSTEQDLLTHDNLS